MRKINCHYCDKSLRITNKEHGHNLYCPRCDSLIYHTGESRATITSLSISSLIVFLWAISQPLLNVNILYDTQISIIDSISLLLKSDILSGTLLIFTIIIIPISILLLILLILYYKELRISMRYLKVLIRTYIFIKEWNMISIYFVGLLVSMVKITDISSMTILTGLWINALFVILLYITVNCFNPYDTLHLRSTKTSHKSLNKSIFFIILALIFLPAANLLPIMPIYKYSVYFPNTLLDGVISFYEEGDYFVSFVILISSIILPFIKLLGITFMIIMVKYNIFLSLRKTTTKFYIFINKISKFSMIDIYVVVLASSFIQYDNLIRIEIGTAFIPFTLVVFFTVLANKSFDTKLIWKDTCIHDQ